MKCQLNLDMISFLMNLIYLVNICSHRYFGNLIRSQSGFYRWESKGFCDTVSEFRVSLVEVFNGSFQNRATDSFHGACSVGNSVLFHGLTHNPSEKDTRLRKIAIRVVWLVSSNKSGYSVGRVAGFFVESKGVIAIIEGVWLIIWS